MIFALLCLLANSDVRAESSRSNLDAKALDIEVQDKAFGRASAADITVVLQSAAGELWRHCPQTQLGGINVYRRTDHPQTDLKRTAGGRIAIGLTAHDTFWAQYSFQFAHEFCHALANYSDNQRAVRYPRHANIWLEESLCEAASLFTLRAMACSWQADPPYPAWRSYAPYFNSYVEQRLALREYHLPVGIPFSIWFHANEFALRQNPDLRDRDTIIATQLLPLFEGEPRGWETLAFLNRNTHDSKQSLAAHLAQWRAGSPRELRPFITKVASVFAVKL